MTLKEFREQTKDYPENATLCDTWGSEISYIGTDFKNAIRFQSTEDFNKEYEWEALIEHADECDWTEDELLESWFRLGCTLDDIKREVGYEAYEHFVIVAYENGMI